MNHERVSYLPRNCFLRHLDDCVKSGMSARTVDVLEWNDQKEIVNNEHKKVCDHAEHNVFKILLEQNGMWSDEAAH